MLKKHNISKIGIANCTTFIKEANQLESILADAGFQVEKVTLQIRQDAI